jgi:hypothetical protein
MKKYIQVIGVSIIATIMYGCANTDPNIIRETARVIGGNVSPEHVTITNIDRGMSSMTWEAAAPTGNYNCSGDYLLRRVLCDKK